MADKECYIELFGYTVCSRIVIDAFENNNCFVKKNGYIDNFKRNAIERYVYNTVTLISTLRNNNCETATGQFYEVTKRLERTDRMKFIFVK